MLKHIAAARLLLESAVTSFDYGSLTSTLGKSLADCATACTTVIGVILPVGIGIFGMYVIVGFSKRIFKRITAG
jgi:hypothetical protein